MECVARYREFLPDPDLRPFVRSFFTFTIPGTFTPAGQSIIRERIFKEGENFGGTMFADGYASLVFSFGEGYSIEGAWRGSSPGHVIGATVLPRKTEHGKLITQIGAYLQAATLPQLAGLPADTLRDRVIALSDLWGTGHARAADQLMSESGDAARIRAFQRIVRSRLVNATAPETSLDIPAMAATISGARGYVRIDALAAASGVSRQHLTRVFRRHVGVSPKLFARLIRFRAALTCADAGAAAAADLGYTDQSHMIAEIRRFSGLPPRRLAGQFHPFIDSRFQGR